MTKTSDRVTRVAVFGAAGRMGAEVCRAVEADSLLTLAARFDPHAQEPTIMTDLDRLSADDIDVVVDFTVADAARENLSWCARHGLHAVVGTTGFSDDDLGRLSDEFTSSACLVAPNFAISAVLMMRLAAQAAPYFDSVEIIELHHDHKRDAPSGTAIATARVISEASTEWGADPTEAEVFAGARGGRGPGGIPIHSVRLRGLVAHQEVLFGTTGQSLTIRQDSYDRTSFMPGVVAAVKAISGRTGLIVGLDQLLFD